MGQQRSRHSSVTASSIGYSMWLIFDPIGNARMSRGETALKANERAMQITVALPTSLFKTPSLSGSIVITDDQARDKIIAAVEHDAAKVLRDNLGLNLNLKVEAK